MIPEISYFHLTQHLRTVINFPDYVPLAYNWRVFFKVNLSCGSFTVDPEQLCA